jgi:hypothetical protein
MFGLSETDPAGVALKEYVRPLRLEVVPGP